MYINAANLFETKNRKFIQIKIHTKSLCIKIEENINSIFRKSYFLQMCGSAHNKVYYSDTVTCNQIR